MTLGVVKPRSPVERCIEEPGIVGEPNVVVSELCRRREEFGPQLDLEPRQSKHLNRIIVGLEMFSPSTDLHQEDRENFITNVIRDIGNFLIHEERL